MKRLEIFHFTLNEYYMKVKLFIFLLFILRCNSFHQYSMWNVRQLSNLDKIWNETSSILWLFIHSFISVWCNSSTILLLTKPLSVMSCSEDQTWGSTNANNVSILQIQYMIDKPMQGGTAIWCSADLTALLVNYPPTWNIKIYMTEVAVDELFHANGKLKHTAHLL